MRPAVLIAALLAACASAPPPPPGTQADAARVAAHVVPGQSTRASVLAALGPTTALRFDNGFEVWRYQVPQGANRFAEFVILFGPDGVVRKTRARAPDPPPRQGN